MANTSMGQPLQGVRVLDLSRLLPGPFASMVLADLGAQVDKVEDPRGGDYLRVMPPQQDGTNATFRQLNRGKRSVVLDLKHPDGVAALKALVPRYDVLIESFRPGVMTRLGIDYDALRALHPGLIYCAITGYGQTGPYAERAGHDLNYMAAAGTLAMGGPVDAPPQVMPVQVADVGGGAMFAVTGILAALYERARTGEGRFLDISMTEGAMAFGVFGLSAAWAGQAQGRGDDVLSGGLAVYNTYRTSDGGHVSLAALEPKFWTTFCRAVGLEPRMDALAPGPHQRDVKAAVAQVIASRSLDEWQVFAAQHDCCLVPLVEPDALAAHPQHMARDVFADNGLMRLPVGAPQSSDAPTQGAQTRAILAEAGLDDAAIDALIERGVAGR